MFIRQDSRGTSQLSSTFNCWKAATGAPRDSTARKKLLDATGVLLLSWYHQNAEHLDRAVRSAAGRDELPWWSAWWGPQRWTCNQEMGMA